MAFSKMPVEVWLDHRLTLKQIRVLGAILSFADRDGSSCHPKTEAIAERCGMLPRHVSTATSELAKLGWIKKDGKGGFSQPATYTITLPELGSVEPSSNQGVFEENNPPQIVEQTLPESGSKTLPELGRGKEQTNYQTNTRKPAVLENGVSDGDEVGKKRRAAKPSVSLARFLDECAKSGELPIPPDDPIFKQAAKENIPDDFLHLCWLEFKSQHLTIRASKRQADWRATFRNCVRGQWYGLWYTAADGTVSLTSKGNAAKLRHREAA